MKVFLAGGESYIDVMSTTEYPNIFTSFYSKENAGKLINALGDKAHIIVDSGAHSFFSQNLEHSASIVKAKKNKRTSLENLDNYVNEYCDFMDKYKDKVWYFVELDIDKLVGVDKVKEIRAKLESHCGKDKLMVAYHPTMGTWDEVKEELLSYGYIGLEGVTAGGTILYDYNKVVKDCYEHNVKVHAFAMTKKQFLSKIPVYSTDSTSWSSVVRFGRSSIRGKNMDPLRQKFESYKVSKSRADSAYILTKEVEAWKGFQQHFTDLWEKRGIQWKD